MSKHKMERSQQRIQRQEEIIADVRSKRIMWQSSSDCRRKSSECQESLHAERYSCLKMLTVGRWVEQLTPEKRVWNKEK